MIPAASGSGPGCAAPGPAGAAAPAVPAFTRTTGYRHDSIPAGVAALRELGAEHGFAVHVTEDHRVLTAGSLAGYAAVTALGHADEAYGDAEFRRQLLGGLLWAGGLGTGGRP